MLLNGVLGVETLLTAMLQIEVHPNETLLIEMCLIEMFLIRVLLIRALLVETSLV